MTWLAVLVAFLAAGVPALLMPRAIAGLPEPPPRDPDVEYVGPAREPDAPPKPLYRDLAAGPRVALGLALGSGLSAAVMALGTGWDWRLLPLVVLCPPGAALAYVDARTRLLPSRLVYPALAVGAVAVAVAALLAGEREIAIRGLLGGAGTFLLFHLMSVVVPRMMGYGDVRLSAVVGMGLAQVGWAELGVGLYAGWFLLAIGGLLLSRLGFASSKRFPFGPWMLLGAVVGIPLGEPIAGLVVNV